MAISMLRDRAYTYSPVGLCHFSGRKCLSFPEIFRNGTPLCDILVRRAQAGTFASDPDQYVGDALKEIG